MMEGVVMLLLYSAGLGIPFILSAVLIDKFKTAFDFIKRNYNTVNIISGSMLIFIGVFMATGHINKLLAILS
jgi:cytochrome c-type biogenesis protein